LKNKKIFNDVNIIKNIENIFLVEKEKRLSSNNIKVPNIPLLTKPLL
jgi:hypothetical protein